MRDSGSGEPLVYFQNCFQKWNFNEFIYFSIKCFFTHSCKKKKKSNFSHDFVIMDKRNCFVMGITILRICQSSLSQELLNFYN